MAGLDNVAGNDGIFVLELIRFRCGAEWAWTNRMPDCVPCLDQLENTAYLADDIVVGLDCAPCLAISTSGLRELDGEVFGKTQELLLQYVLTDSSADAVHSQEYDAPQKPAPLRLEHVLLKVRHPS